MLRFLTRMFLITRDIFAHPFSDSALVETEDGRYYAGHGETTEQALARAMEQYEAGEAERKRSC